MPSLPICQVLEEEYTALTGRPAPAAPDVRFVAAQLIDTIGLAQRLITSPDRVATLLRTELLVPQVAALVSPVAAGDGTRISALLVDIFNQLLDDPRLFDVAHRRCFDGVRFRSQTEEALDHAGVPGRAGARLLLEDAFPQWQQLFRLRTARVQRAMHRAGFWALCLSGGGIRSATFALGVVQGLARHQLLGEFDYLSTVSGGGFTGGWLSAWIERTSFAHVLSTLGRQRTAAEDPDPPPVAYLRDYTNYLTPRVGMLSADVWTLIATVWRNLLINWIPVVPVVMALVALPRLLASVIAWQPVGAAVAWQSVLGIVFAKLAVIATIVAIVDVQVNRPMPRPDRNDDAVDDPKRTQRHFLRWCLAPLMIATVSMVICWAWETSYASMPGSAFVRSGAWLWFGLVGAAIYGISWLIATWLTRRRMSSPPSVRWRQLASNVAIGFGLGWLACRLAQVAPALWSFTPAGLTWYTVLAVPALLLLVLLLNQLYVGYSSARRTDADREWSARFTGWVLIAGVAWLVGCGLPLIGPPLWLRIVAWHGWAGMAGKVGGALAGVLSVRLAGTTVQPAAADRPAPYDWRKSLALALAAAFLCWLIVVLAIGGESLLELVDPAASRSTGSLLVRALVIACLGGFGLVSAWFIDTNKFSLHALYRARLIRSYLGASRPAGTRDPNPFTGFDDDDNPHLADLRHDGTAPLHVINATLDLLHGDKLAWQERKAEGFTMSALHCGSGEVGYRRTGPDPRAPSVGGYGGAPGVSLGTALAISGAAMSPDMGPYSSPVLTVLMTLFNVRLGVWLGNPGYAGRKVFDRSEPALSIRPVFDEALGRTDDRNSYVYLSDGGHFENLGLYEMIRRRCRVCLVSDASADPHLAFDDLANAIRKIRIDLGVPITLDLDALRQQASGGGRGPAYAIGTIHYSRVDATLGDGVLVYLKPLVLDGSAVDVASFARSNAGFPNSALTDQWFSESEFESYRVLGDAAVDQLGKQLARYR